MQVNEIRESFVSFAQSRGYRLIEPEPLVSPIFPTTFVVSGGPNFVAHYLNDPPLASAKYSGNSSVVQPCFRFWDIACVGDGKHLSFFEMLVLNSLDGFNRERLLKDQFDFLTNGLGIDKTKIFASVFAGGEVKGKVFPKDEEAYMLCQTLGIPKDQIVQLEGMDCFVANSVEPVGGPRLEWHYEMFKKDGTCQPRCIPGKCTCGKYLEFFTHVLYNQRVRFVEKKAEFKPIEKSTIAAGFGLERVAQIINSQRDIAEVDCVSTIAESIAHLQNHPTMNVVAEHIRGVVFLIADGAADLKNVEERSRVYQYRKYLKKFYSAMQSIGLNQSALELLVDETIRQYQPFYPYIAQSRGKVLAELSNRMKMAEKRG